MDRLIREKTCFFDYPSLSVVVEVLKNRLMRPGLLEKVGFAIATEHRVSSVSI